MRLPWWRPRQDDELREELAAHLRMAVEERIEQGQPPEEAEARARAELGNQLRVREATRQEWGWIAAEQVAQDVRYALRALGKSPGFAATAILVLGLGIGVNALMFTVVHAVLLRPLPFPESARVVMVRTLDEASGAGMTTSPPDFYTARERARTFQNLAAFYQRPFNITGGPESERVQIFVVSSDFFRVLGVHPALGRDFTPGDERWGAHRVVLLTDGLWKRRYGSDPRIVGRTMTLDGTSYQVIGVLPPLMASFAGVLVQAYVPMSFAPGDNLNTHNNAFLTLVGRLRAGVALGAAVGELRAIAAGIQKEFPESRGLSFAGQPLQDAMVADVKATLWVLMGAVGFVMLIATANLANLLLTRAVARAREVALRTALGASRARLLRQFITESVVLSLLGSGGGLLLSYWGVRLVRSLSLRVLPRANEVHLDTTVLFFALGLGVATAILFGAAPALHSVRLNLTDVLRAGTRGSAHSSGRLRAALVVAEVALSLVLLAGSALMLESMYRLWQVDPGFDPRNVISAYINLPVAKYVDERLASQFKPEALKKAVDYYDEIFDRIRRLDGVVAVGAISNLPLTVEAWSKTLTLYDRPLPSSLRDMPSMQYRVVAGDYFRAIGIGIVEGRGFSSRDTAISPRVVVVNQTLARRFWPNESAVGKQLSVNPPVSLMPAGTVPTGYEGPEKFTVIGIAHDVHYGALQNTPEPLVYALESQGGEGAVGLQLVVRTTGDPMLLVPALRTQLSAVDRDVPLSNVTRLDTLLANQFLPSRIELTTLGTVAALAALLAVVGIYGVVSYSVSRRTHEIGIRMALGATPGQVVAQIVTQGAAIVGAGLAIGLVAARLLTRLMQHMLFGVSPTDAVALGAVTVLLAVSAVVASYVPARRAARIDPHATLASE